MRARLMILFTALVALLVLSGCPETSAISTEACAHVGDPCRLPSGPMGVCSESLATECEHPPCLACTSQH